MPSADAAQAVAALDAWWTQLERVYADPSVPVTTLDPLTSGQGRKITRGFVARVRQEGWHASGHARWVSQTVTEASSAQGLDVVRIRACQDVSQLRMLDSKNKDVTPPKRPNRAQAEYLVSRSGSGWTVSDITSATPC